MKTENASDDEMCVRDGNPSDDLHNQEKNKY